MNIWIPITVFSATVGLIAGLAARRLSMAVVTGAVIPWLGLLGYLLYNEYYVPYQGGGASMWLIAQLVGGTAAAVIGGFFSATGWFVRSLVSPRREDTQRARR